MFACQLTLPAEVEPIVCFSLTHKHSTDIELSRFMVYILSGWQAFVPFMLQPPMEFYVDYYFVLLEDPQTL